MKNLNISFIGPSCSGKTTRFKYAKRILEKQGFTVFRCDVALPLRQIQTFAYKTFELPSCGNPELPESFNQDGEILSLLASRFEPFLGIHFKNRIQKINLDSPTALINTDCRNNCYKVLKDLDFIFIKVDSSDPIISERRKRRGDLTAFSSTADVERFNEIEPSFSIENNSTFDALEQQIKDIIGKSQTQQGAHV
jgi:hypothetical protein